MVGNRQTSIYKWLALEFQDILFWLQNGSFRLCIQAVVSKICFSFSPLFNDYFFSHKFCNHDFFQVFGGVNQPFSIILVIFRWSKNNLPGQCHHLCSGFGCGSILGSWFFFWEFCSQEVSVQLWTQQSQHSLFFGSHSICWCVDFFEYLKPFFQENIKEHPSRKKNEQKIRKISFHVGCEFPGTPRPTIYK